MTEIQQQIIVCVDRLRAAVQLEKLVYIESAHELAQDISTENWNKEPEYKKQFNELVDQAKLIDDPEIKAFYSI